jgi:multidrug resistance efflux pump
VLRVRERCWGALLLGAVVAAHAVAQTAAPGAPAAAASKPVAVDPSAIRVLLVPELETTLSAQMNGTLGEINASLGRQVPKGALLVQLQCGEQQARAKVAEAELVQARQNLDAKKSLRDLNAVGDLEVSMASTEVEKASGAAHAGSHAGGLLHGARAVRRRRRQGLCEVLPDGERWHAAVRHRERQRAEAAAERVVVAAAATGAGPALQGEHP